MSLRLRSASRLLRVGMPPLTSACSSARFGQIALLACVPFLCACGDAVEGIGKEQLRSQYADVLQVQPAATKLTLIPPGTVGFTEGFEVNSGDVTFAVPVPAATRKSTAGETPVLEYPGFEATVFVHESTYEPDPQVKARWGETAFDRTVASYRFTEAQLAALHTNDELDLALAKLTAKQIDLMSRDLSGRFVEFTTPVLKGFLIGPTVGPNGGVAYVEFFLADNPDQQGRIVVASGGPLQEEEVDDFVASIKVIANDQNGSSG